MKHLKSNLTLLQVNLILSSITSNNYIVGGYIRDSLLGLKPKDIDIVTDAPYDLMATAFKHAGWQVNEIGKCYIVLNISKHHEHFEISNFRSDKDNKGGVIGNILSDAYRRDFTVNALYYNLSTGNIEDPTYKGLNDITSRILRFIGKPQDRLQEDPLRAYRFYRLLATKSLIPEPRSLRAIRKEWTHIQSKIAPERSRNEIERIVGLS